MRADLSADQRVAPGLVGEILVLAAADDAAVGCRAHIEIGVRRLPDEGGARPDLRGCGCVAIAQVEMIRCAAAGTMSVSS